MEAGHPSTFQVISAQEGFDRDEIKFSMVLILTVREQGSAKTPSWINAWYEAVMNSATNPKINIFGTIW